MLQVHSSCTACFYYCYFFHFCVNFNNLHFWPFLILKFSQVAVFPFWLWVFDIQLFTGNFRVEVYESKNYELNWKFLNKFIDSDWLYQWLELYTHLLIRFWSNSFEDWNCTLSDLLFILWINMYWETFCFEQALHFRKWVILLP